MDFNDTPEEAAFRTEARVPDDPQRMRALVPRWIADGRLSGGAVGTGLLQALPDGGLAPDLERELEVLHRVLVAAVHTGVLGQGVQLRERLHHLRGGPGVGDEDDRIGAGGLEPG